VVPPRPQERLGDELSPSRIPPRPRLSRTEMELELQSQVLSSSQIHSPSARGRGREEGELDDSKIQDLAMDVSVRSSD